MNKAEQLIKELQDACYAKECSTMPVSEEERKRWKQISQNADDALEAIVNYVPEPSMSFNDEQITSEHYWRLHKELLEQHEAEQNYQKHIRLLKQSLEAMTMLIEKIYAEITNKNMDLLVLTNEHAAQIKKAKELVNKEMDNENLPG